MGLDATPFLLPLLFQVGFGLSPLQAGLKSFSGATILGDGSVALILDTVHLVGMGAHKDEFKSEVGRAA